MVDNVESTKNLTQKLELKNTFVPQIDYSEPENFAKYGSAFLYYKSSLERIYNFFPYDGSDGEINEFFNQSLPHERYIFDNLYPRTNGYANFDASSFISLKGGPHSTSYTNLNSLFKEPDSSKRSQANIYETDIYQHDNKPSDYALGSRESNLKCDFSNGVTVEFWLKTSAISADTKRSIFHLTNSSGGDALTIFLSGTVGSPFHINLDKGGTSVLSDKQVGLTITTGSMTSFAHYALSFKSSSSGLSSKFFVNGELNESKVIGPAPSGSFTQKGTLGYIASGSVGLLGVSSMDEFRFWKTERNGFQIGTNYFTQVRGGTNTDVSNATLGVYYKFNEGTTGDSTTDRIVLDYAGRLTNGTWVGTPSRTLQSAIVEAGAATKEFKDPIIYDTHPDVISLQALLEDKGKFHDHNNATKFINYVPSWVIEEAEGEGNGDSQLEMVSHIIGTYFDKLYLQIQSVADFKQPVYTSSSHKPLTFARNLPQSLGLYTPEIFIDSDIINKVRNKTEKFSFESNLEDTKNLIYLNLYNNLSSIFKSKGTEKSIKAVLRCFYIDDQILTLNTYSNKARYQLRNNLEQTTKLNKYANLNREENLGGVIYQRQNPADTTNTIGFISGSGAEGLEFAYGATVEADITFPYFNSVEDTLDRRFKDVSLFGVVSASVGSPDDTTFMAVDNTNFQIYAVRDSEKSKNAFFKLTSSLNPSPFAEVTSSVFFGVYNNQDWNFSVSVIPAKSGSLRSTTGSSDSTYTLRFEGHNTILGDTRDSFTLDTEITKVAGDNFLKSAKRVYAGAYRQNLSGALIDKSDVLISGVRYWLKNIDYGSKIQHALDFDNNGVSEGYKNISALDNNTRNLDILNKDTLALSWEFSNLTGSDSTGNFYVTDFSSGSALIRNNYGWVGNVAGYRHSGYGFGFATSSLDTIESKRINVFKFVDPERVISSDMVSIVDDNQEFFGIPRDVVGYHHTLEKSMYSAVSDEMLKFFAGAADFNNLIGEPVNRYRMNYKALEKLRQAFFLRVQDVKEVEKFIDYYKWFDDSLGDIIKQLIPASAVISENVFDVVESHVLERNKYQSKFPTIEFKTPDPETTILGIREKTFDWEHSHHPISNSQKENSEYWQKRAKRVGSEVISSGVNTVDVQRDTIIETLDKQNTQKAPSLRQLDKQVYSGQTFVLRKLARPYKLTIDRRSNPPRSIHGGANFEVNKNFGFHRVALHPAGPINQSGSIFIPKNIMLGFTEDLVGLEDTTDPPKSPSKLVKRNIKIQSGRDYEEGVGYKNAKSDVVFPFNIVSSSVKTGYNKQVIDRVTASIEIVNLHNDVYGPNAEKPMQGPFTEYAVGGLQYRHVPINKGGDNYLNRPEGWKILLGRCAVTTGAIGMVGADYPYPEANDVGATPYPMTGAQKAFFYRDMVAKRPVNIRNIRHTTGSTILGNYNHNYDVVQAGSAFSTPRQFVEKQPTLPANTFDARARYADTVRTVLDINRTDRNHTDFNGDYSADYLQTGSGESVIISRFSAPGGIETMTKGYQDFRSSQFSVYNTMNARNLTVRRPLQGVTSSIVSETSGTRVFDIHGRDFGLVNHSTRHAARFFRDSTLESNPGASYVERPSFHRIHRNNIVKARRIINTVPVLSGSTLSNLSGAMMNDTSRKARFLVGMDIDGNASISDSRREQFMAEVTSSGQWAISMWLKMSQGRAQNASTFIYGHGKNTAGGQVPFSVNQHNDGEFRIKIFTSDNANGTAPTTGNEFRITGLSASSDAAQYNHFVFAVSGSPGSLSSTLQVHAWKNGVSQSVTYPTTTIRNHFSDYGNTTSTMANFSLGSANKHHITIGGQSNQNNLGWSGSMDEVNLWTCLPTQTQVTELYNGGTPCDVTASNLYTANDGKMWGWWRFGDVSGDAINNANSGRTGSAGKINSVGGKYNDLFWLLPISERLQPQSLSLVNDVPAGCSPVVVGTREVITFDCQDKFDNFNLSHQIPRSDRQYSWITSSIVIDNSCDPRYWGLMPTAIGKPPETAPYYYISGAYTPFFNYVSGTAMSGDLFQNTTRLNLLVTDETGSNTNVLGASTVGTTPLTSLPDGQRLNALLTRRGDNYGYNWRSVRQQDHPILQKQKNNNIITVTSSPTVTYDLKPVSNSGRPVLVRLFATSSVGLDGVIKEAKNTITLKSTYNNEKIGFNDSALEDKTGFNPQGGGKNFEELIGMVKESQNYALNWVLYSENIFPSDVNKFKSSTNFRNTYDNKFWRDSEDLRNLLGNTFPNTFDISVSQSSWPLDPPPNFLTRSGVTYTRELIGSGLQLKAQQRGGGELQNVYSSYANVRVKLAPGAPQRIGFSINQTFITGTMPQAALYSRKHTIEAPPSVVSKTGIFIDNCSTDGGKVQSVSLTSSLLDIYGGEAVWQAGSDAGIVDTSGQTPVFVSRPSKPWFNNYDEFKTELDLVSRGYTMVPEFRISEKVKKYSKGTLSTTDTFEIVGTDKDSSNTGFYKDFSNSEFLKHFTEISELSETTPTEIRLVCNAVSRFNPYKGFYPAQRTINIVEQFVDSYGPAFVVSDGVNTGSAGTDARNIIESSGSLLRPLIQPLFAPGLLYNTIKSGIAVDYPVFTTPMKQVYKVNHSGASGATSPGKSFLLGGVGATTASIPQEIFLKGADAQSQYFDLRVPFEAIINPEAHLAGIDLYDMEPAASASKHTANTFTTPPGKGPAFTNTPGTASINGSPADQLYTKMTDNFFAEIADFFLKDSEFTTLKSKPYEKRTFESGSMYGARLKIRRSMTGQRTYRFDRDQLGRRECDNLTATINQISRFTGEGMRAMRPGYDLNSVSTTPSPNNTDYLTSSIPLPQDPKNAKGYRETFTMYSRPSAFGPPILGGTTTPSQPTDQEGGSVLDSMEGYNWAFTPPYYHGESWVDMLFFPEEKVEYTLERLLSEIKIKQWRVDTGGSGGTNQVRVVGGSKAQPYGFLNINDTAMQLSASLNLFGIENVPFVEVDKSTGKESERNTNVRQRWVIQPKAETPMLNFNDTGVNPVRPISASFASGSIPRGMWHQFGNIPEDPNKGIFVEIGDIPANWLKYHREVRQFTSSYNNEGKIQNHGLTAKVFNHASPATASVANIALGEPVHREMRSLTDLFQFEQTSVRLGELKESNTLREAIVAIPYTSLTTDNGIARDASQAASSELKQFFTIPRERINSALRKGEGFSDSDDAAGQSIRDLVEDVKQYVLPPQFDFVQDNNIAPVVMYFFEFEYSLDKDDLSYIWQNLAPRDYEKMELKTQYSSHALARNELLSAEDVIGNDNLRWMVFKVKQRGMAKYIDKIYPTLGRENKIAQQNAKSGTGYDVSFNWPYDYVSFIEMVNLDAAMLMKKGGDNDG